MLSTRTPIAVPTQQPETNTTPEPEIAHAHDARPDDAQGVPSEDAVPQPSSQPPSDIHAAPFTVYRDLEGINEEQVEATLARLKGRQWTSRIPVELVDMIVGHQRHNPAALRNFSLVTSEWLFAARPLLFHTARIRDFTDLRRWGKLMSSNPTIRNEYLRQVVFEPGLEEFPKKFPDFGPLPKVKKLRWGSDRSQLPEFSEDIRGLTESFVAVEELSITGSAFSLESTINFMSCFKGLKSIRLDLFDYKYVTLDTTRFNMPHIDVSKLEELYLGFNTYRKQTYEWVTKWVLPRGGRKGLKFLNISANQKGISTEDVLKIMRPSYNTIEVLSVSPPPDAVKMDGYYIKKPMASLRTIRFDDIRESYESNSAFPTTRWVTDFICHMPVHRTVTSVQFGFSVGPSIESLEKLFTHFDWPGTIGFLSVTFPSMKEIRLNVVSEEISLNRAQMRQRLARRFKWAAAASYKAGVVTWEDHETQVKHLDNHGWDFWAHAI